MSLSPISKVLSTFRRRGVRALLMGGQGCILYGAAEFTRDIDLAVAIHPDNLRRLRAALSDLRAEPVFFPSLSAAALRRGHACPFRCRAPGFHGLRIDVMSRMRGVDPFARLWKRRQVIHVPRVGPISVMALSDLVQAKKTQRDKDWPMIRRLIEADIARTADGDPDPGRLEFWLWECRTPAILRDLASRFPDVAKKLAR